MEAVQSKKLESNFFNMVLSLLMVAFISSAVLGVVNHLTKDKILKAKQEKKVRAIQSVVLPGFTNDPVKDLLVVKRGAKDIYEVYPAKKDGKITSFAITTFSKNGFSGNISLMVGLLKDGTINKISVLSQKETPGLGTKIEKSSFQKQFENKHPKTFNVLVKKDGGDVDAITGATITSRAFGEAVDHAFRILHSNEVRKIRE